MKIYIYRERERERERESLRYFGVYFWYVYYIFELIIIYNSFVNS